MVGINKKELDRRWKSGVYDNHSKKIKNKWSDPKSKYRTRDFLGENNPNYDNGNKIKGKKNPFYGKKHSKDTKNKISLGTREAFQRNNNFNPRIGKYEKNILNDVEKSLGIKIKRQYKVAGYFLDGYCKELNLAIEVDENAHLKTKQRSKDESRQKIIMDTLKCDFIRIREKDYISGKGFLNIFGSIWNYLKLKKLLKNKEIIVTNTKTNLFAFELAHVLRDFAKVTYCMDPKYKIKESKDRIRKIENGKVYLIGEEFSYNGAYAKINKKLKGDPRYLVIITKL